MKTQKFLQLLATHPEKELVFEYGPGLHVGANYHITEIKNIHIEAVDCGARRDNWNETVIQLWENPAEIGKTTYMTAYKAMGILNKVNRIRTMDPGAVIKIEYGNPSFHTAHLPVEKVTEKDGYFVVHLHTEPTSCKASELCGVQTSSATREEEVACCTPGSSCS